MELETLRYAEVGDVATITLAGGETGNRVNTQFLRDFTHVCHHLEDESPARVVVLRAEGPDFCLGIDFADFDPERPIDIHGFSRWEKMVTLLERLPKVTIAALHGRAVGAGAQLALVCDQRIAAPGTTLQFPEVHLGFLPGMSVFRLAKYVGLGRAKRLLLTAAELELDESEALGLIDARYSSLDEGIEDTIRAFGPIHVVAVEMARRLLNESFHDSYEDAIGHFLAAQHRCVTQAAFLENLENAGDE